ncbi:MAG: coenzyme F420-0:L-glutamate ligase [Alphaproteobacteria bacterium]|nr:coenzyme F420-0:L-glutamate ligase [Alphaproteobacteria bacterium]
MKLTALKSPKVHAGDDLDIIVDACIPTLQERSILAVTSKIVSLCEKAIISKNNLTKEALIQAEADYYALPSPTAQHSFYLTIKHNLLIASAGVDESNGGENAYILYPGDPFASAKNLWTLLRERDGVESLGIIITDSHTMPLRRGVTGVSLAWCGFDPLKNYVGTKDCFDKPLCYTQRNNVDALAAAAVFMMGEGNEQTPFCLIENIKDITFLDHPPSGNDKKSVLISMVDDLYAPILSHVPWKKGGGA